MKCMALLFSGRKNPEWEIKDAVQQQKIIGLIQSAPATGNPLRNAILGYAGFRLIHENAIYEVFNGVLEVVASGEKKTLEDRGRAIEKILLQTVPAKFTGVVSTFMTDPF